MKDLISIIVPCYNQAQYLDECLQSVYSQTCEDWECIIINDGSPDNTQDVANKWVVKDSRFRYYEIENSGVSSARNFGINQATGNWILPLDGDDKIGNNYLLLAKKEMQNNSTIIYCKAQYFGEKTGEFALEHFTKYELLYSNKIFCTAFFKKEFWENLQGYDETMKDGYEDWEFWIRIIFNKNFKIKIKKLNYVGFFYRIKKVSRNTVAKKILV
jgi:cellulose synthase/poly-beta-1,6-N-acetylglucosamine synthase-like glycosyltransferase